VSIGDRDLGSLAYCILYILFCSLHYHEVAVQSSGGSVKLDG
jgi:hypothetical protein